MGSKCKGRLPVTSNRGRESFTSIWLISYRMEYHVALTSMSHRKTSAAVASKAAKVLNSPKASKAAKAAAASALSQRATRDYGKRKKR